MVYTVTKKQPENANDVAPVSNSVIAWVGEERSSQRRGAIHKRTENIRSYSCPSLRDHPCTPLYRTPFDGLNIIPHRPRVDNWSSKTAALTVPTSLGRRAYVKHGSTPALLPNDSSRPFGQLRFMPPPPRFPLSHVHSYGLKKCLRHLSLLP